MSPGFRRETAFYAGSLVTIVSVALLSPEHARLVVTAASFTGWAVFCRLFQSRRAARAAIVSATVFLVTLTASWIWGGTLNHAHQSETVQLRAQFRFTADAVRRFRTTNDRLPESLSDTEIFDEDIRWAVRGPWNRPLRYRAVDDDFELTSLGRDGLPGGTGIDADITLRSDEFDALSTRIEAIRIPFRQYLTATESSRALLFPILLCSLISQHLLRTDEDLNELTEHPFLYSAALVVVLSAVCTFLGMIHVAASQSGH